MNKLESIRDKHAQSLTYLNEQLNSVEELIAASRRMGEGALERASLIDDHCALRAKVRLVKEFVADLDFLIAERKEAAE